MQDFAMPFVRSASPEVTREYMGNLLRFLAGHGDTNGRCAILLYESRVGNEPPPHVHLWEHEFYYLLEGEVEYFIEGLNHSLTATAGDLVFLPGNRAHAFFIRSGAVKKLMLLQASGEHPVDSDSYFQDTSQPVGAMRMPEHASTYSTETDLSEHIRLAAIHGMLALDSEQVISRLPNYPGFKANLA